MGRCDEKNVGRSLSLSPLNIDCSALHTAISGIVDTIVRQNIAMDRLFPCGGRGDPFGPFLDFGRQLRCFLNIHGFLCQTQRAQLSGFRDDSILGCLPLFPLGHFALLRFCEMVLGISLDPIFAGVA
jgi:hypothetical protein